MKISHRDLKKSLSIAREAALLAGKFLMKNKNRKINKEVGRDIKIAADVESEKIVISFLKAHSDFPILSEEAGLIGDDNDGFMWIVDPLDGTFNYTRGIPFCCVSIGLWHGEEPVLGVVNDFNRSELFSGIVWEGAWLNGRKIKVSTSDKKEKAVLSTGFPVNTDFSSQGISRFIDNVRSYKKTRLFGSAALSIAYVASGRTDVYQEGDIMLWDIGGGIPVLLGAGGSLDIKRAFKKHSYNVFASNGLR